jgi:peptide/nickel transport system substrate-binding protein
MRKSVLFLLSLFITIGLTLSAFAPTSAQSTEFKQSPFLDGKDLPPVAERLPKNPMVITPLAGENQQYGGNLRTGFVGGSASWGGNLFQINQWEGLVQWSADFSTVEPALAERIEVNEDATEYTFYLREGLKWSDGQPYTADDIMFYIEDVGLNVELSPGGISPDWLPADQAEGFKAEKIDETTFKFTFAKPYGTLPYVLASWGGRFFTYYPKHHLTRFHKEYNPNVDELVAAEQGIQDWVGLFNKFGPDAWGNPDRFFEHAATPVMGPWYTVQPLGTGSTILLERNPYYWKVDLNGNQLPYIDTITAIQYQDSEARTLAMLNGDLDWIGTAPPENRAIFHDAMNEGKPIAIQYPRPTESVASAIYFNRSIGDPVKAELFANRDFRIGMSHAINRPELIEIAYAGQGTPAQPSPLEDSPFYNEQLTTQYTEYNIDLANEYLDKVIPDRGADGFRLGPDGNPLEIVFFVPNDLSWATNYTQVGELLVGYWREVGVNVLLNAMPTTQYDQARLNNTVEAVLFAAGDGAGIAPILSSRDIMPIDPQSIYGNAWFYWYNKRTDATSVEPPQFVKDLYTQFSTEVLGGSTLEQQTAGMNALIETAVEEFWVIGTARPGSMYLPHNAALQGIPATWYEGFTPGGPKIYRPEQWFFAQ